MTKIVLWAVVAIAGTLSACVGGLFLWVYVGTAGSAVGADAFLSTVARGDIGSAYQQTAAALRLEQDEEQFVTTVSLVGISSYELKPWRDRTIDYRGRNTYRGTITTEAGRPMPFRLGMLIEDGEWRVETFTGPGRSNVGPGAWFTQVPSTAELTSLARNTMRDFELALRKRDFTELRDNMWSALWYTVKDMEAEYKHFLDERIDLSGVLDVGPEFTQPARLEPYTEGTVLIVTGRFPVEGAGVPFRFRYRYDHPEWKLNQIYVGRPGNPDFLAP